jgi:hypothetical protein
LPLRSLPLPPYPLAQSLSFPNTGEDALGLN